MNRFFNILLFITLMSLATTKASAYDFAIENEDGVTIYYNYINGGLELEVTCGFNSTVSGVYAGRVVIPEKVTYMSRTRKVSRIGDYAFKYCGLVSISIPNSVTSIGNYAFRDCYDLMNIVIPNSVTTIGDHAFYNCFSLTDITLPNSITHIRDCMFIGCRSLSSITIPNSVTNICDFAFDGCFSLASVTIPNSVTTIGDYAFRSCSALKNIVIPKSVISIGYCAFACCFNLTSITIPNSVISIGGQAFALIDLTTVVSHMDNPCNLTSSTFSKNTFNNATLYVPIGTINKYKATDGWNNFLFIEEGGPNAIVLPNDIEMMILSNDGEVQIKGVTSGMTINIFDTAGRMVGSAKVSTETTKIKTSLHYGDIFVVKIGDKAIKMLMKQH